MKLIIPMAGRGTRVRPHSHVTPKPLLNVKGKSMVERIIDTFVAVLPRGLDEAVFVLGPDFGEDVRRQLADICEKNNIQPYFRVQDKAQGTAHAVICADDRLEGEGIVVFADTLFGMEPGVDLEDADVIAWVKHVDDPSRFGVAVRKGDNIVAFVEKPKEPISNEALIGIYYVKDLTKLRRAIEYLIENDVTGHGSEYQLTDAFDRLLKEGLVFKTATVTEWLDCGTIDALLDTTRVILDKENGDLRQGSVENSVIREPVYVGPGARVTGSVVGPYVSVEAGAQVSGSVIQDSIIFSDAQVDHAMLKDSLVGRYAKIKGHAHRVNVGDHTELG
ncbi:MAG TPA: sugar phosphate nucleotidyltransferase [Rhodothermales bacterium]|nr:sugar phosphate nucleotidyltransferase [Rhodothermales bacterium]